jgi:CRISPR-associated protein Cas2
MKCLLVYDIPNDRVRTKVADICLDYGLERIQYSAFLGKLHRNLQEELMLKIKRKMGKKEGNVRLYPICDKDLQQSLEIDNGPTEAQREEQK